MHELSVALRIVESLEHELADEGEIEVAAVCIQVGALTGIVPEALQFAWPHAAEPSLLRGSRLEIEWVEAAGLCPTCGIERTITNLQSFRCPVCGSPIGEIAGGNELDILSVEVRDLRTGAET